MNDFIEEEYKKRDANRAKIQKILAEIPERPASKGPNGSHYPYMTRIGEFYFTHSDFETAIVSGKHPFYAFSEWSAREHLKKNHPEQYKELGEVIDTRVKSREIVDPKLKSELIEKDMNTPRKIERRAKDESEPESQIPARKGFL